METQLKVTTKHFRMSSGYTDSSNCPLAMAAKEHFKTNDVSVICGDIKVGLQHFSVTNDWRSGQTVYGGKWKGMNIDGMIRAVKDDNKLRIPTKVLTLTHVPTF